jgi:hypothetical protein
MGLAFTASAQAACPAQALSQPFAAWNDLSYYQLLDGGRFESGAPGWTLNKAVVVADNESYHVAGAADSHALELPGGSSATTPPICVEWGYPTQRFFARTVIGSSKSNSTLKVELLFTNLSGKAMAQSGGTISNTTAWAPTRSVIATPGLSIKPDAYGNTWMRYRFTPLYSTKWRIDDTYVDPKKH